MFVMVLIFKFDTSKKGHLSPYTNANITIAIIIDTTNIDKNAFHIYLIHFPYGISK